MRTTAIVVLVLSCLTGACDRAPEARSDHETRAADAPAPASASAADHDAPARTDLSGASGGSLRTEVTTADAPEAGRAREDVKASEGFREVTLPAGTVLPLLLDTPVASDSSRSEQTVRAHLARPVRANGVTALAAGTVVTGTLTSVIRAGRVKGRAQVAMDFDTVVRPGESERYALAAAPVVRRAPATKKEDTLKVVAPAAGGAIIGRIAGGRKGAAIGTAIGAGGGAAVVASTRGKEVRLGKGARLSVTLSAPLSVRVPRD